MPDRARGRPRVAGGEPAVAGALEYAFEAFPGSDVATTVVRRSPVPVTVVW